MLTAQPAEPRALPASVAAQLEAVRARVDALDYERIADIVAATAVTVSDLGDQFTRAG